MIYTFSKFNYGQTVTAANQTILFAEGSGPQLTAQLPIGSYTLGELAQVFADTLTQNGSLAYSGVVNRATGTISISATSPFNLYGSQSASTAISFLGFSPIDYTGQSSYSGMFQPGQIYAPQFMLQSYTPPENYGVSLDPTINQAASGRVELVRFGFLNKIEFELKFITNLEMDGMLILNNPTGLSDALNFLNFMTTKSRFEFVPDVSQPQNVYKVILESTDFAADGTGFKLKEVYDDIAPDIYETGLITLQVVQ